MKIKLVVFNNEIENIFLFLKQVRIWESRSSKAAATISTKGENINIAWAPDGKTILLKSLKGVFSKPSGKMIVALIFCF